MLHGGAWVLIKYGAAASALVNAPEVGSGIWSG